MAIEAVMRFGFIEAILKRTFTVMRRFLKHQFDGMLSSHIRLNKFKCVRDGISSV